MPYSHNEKANLKVELHIISVWVKSLLSSYVALIVLMALKALIALALIVL